MLILHREIAATAAKNKSLAKSNKSGAGGKATKTRNIIKEFRDMTLQEAKSIARHLGLTLRKVRSGDYRVSFPEGSAAYYTDDLEDAVNTAVEMARRQAL